MKCRALCSPQRHTTLVPACRAPRAARTTTPPSAPATSSGRWAPKPRLLLCSRGQRLGRELLTPSISTSCLCPPQSSAARSALPPQPVSSALLTSHLTEAFPEVSPILTAFLYSSPPNKTCNYCLLFTVSCSKDPDSGAGACCSVQRHHWCLQHDIVGRMLQSFLE